MPRQRRSVRLPSFRLAFRPDSSVECPHAPPPVVNATKNRLIKRTLTLVVLIITQMLAFAQRTVVFQNLTGVVKEWVGASGFRS